MKKKKLLLETVEKKEEIVSEKISAATIFIAVLIFFFLFMIVNIYWYKQTYQIPAKDTRVLVASLGTQKIVDANGSLEREEDLLTYLPDDKLIHYSLVMDVPSKNYAYFYNKNFFSNNPNWIQNGLVSQGKDIAASNRLSVGKNGKTFGYQMFTHKGTMILTVNGISLSFPYTNYSFNQFCNNRDGYAFAGSYIKDPKTFYLVINGKEIETVKGIIDFIVSSDCKKYAYIVENNSPHKKYVVFNGKKGNVYDDIDTVAFSPDGKHFAYFGKKNDGWHIIKDWIEDTKNTYAGFGRILFSPDSKHMAYAFIEEVNNKFYQGISLDNKKIANYDLIASIIFSPDSNHLAYVIEDDLEGKVYLIVDNKKVVGYSSTDNSIGRLQFTTDSKMVVGRMEHYTSQTDFTDTVFFGSKTGVLWSSKDNEQIFTELNFSLDNKYVEYGAQRGKKLLWVKERIQ